jgi:hypothetical protein
MGILDKVIDLSFEQQQIASNIISHSDPVIGPPSSIISCSFPPLLMSGNPKKPEFLTVIN